MTVLMNFRVEEDVRQKFHIWCIENRTNIAERLRSHIESDLNAESKINQARLQKRIAAKNGKQEVNDWRDEMFGSRWEESY